MKDRVEETPGFYRAEDCDTGEFLTLLDRATLAEDVPQASECQHQIPIYDALALESDLADPVSRQGVMAEWANVLLKGAGVFVIRQAQTDHDAIDAATAAYGRIIAAEKAAGGDGADHFATAGSNDRIWNSLQKLALAEPRVFARYFASPAIDAASEAWLGPNYQMTAQINLVRPGGQAQQAHRDYHLGFQTAEVSASYPAHVHDLSPLMTLQGGIAHCDMTVESGPTKLLPFSQLYRPGYAAWRRDDFRAIFEDRYVQLALGKGDAIFFSPALFHAAGENRSADIERMVNLLQVSSAFGRAMESVDRAAMCRAVFPALRALKPQLSDGQVRAVIAATAEGYSFPTNLDSDPPSGGLAPETQAALLARALHDGLSDTDLGEALDAMAARQRP